MHRGVAYTKSNKASNTFDMEILLNQVKRIVSIEKHIELKNLDLKIQSKSSLFTGQHSNSTVYNRSDIETHFY